MFKRIEFLLATGNLNSPSGLGLMQVDTYHSARLPHILINS